MTVSIVQYGLETECLSGFDELWDGPITADQISSVR